MSGPKPRTIAFLRSGFVSRPRIDKAMAEKEFGQEIPEPVWRSILDAFDRSGQICDMLDGPRANRNRDDPRSYSVARDRAEGDLEKALELVSRISVDREMVFAMAAAAGDFELEHSLDAASFAIRAALRLVQDAANPPTVVLTKSDARKELARSILGILAKWGVRRDLTGWDEAAMDGLAEADMKPAERLISALGVHDAASPSAFVRWLRDADRSE